MSATVLVAHSAEDERNAISAALYDAGYDVIQAGKGEEALRSTAGVNPSLVIAHNGLKGIAALEVYSRLHATGLALPPFVILVDDPSAVPDPPPEGELYFVPTAGLTPQRLVRQVRLLQLARDMGGEFGEGLEVLHGDLTRAPFGDLLHALLKHVITGQVRFAVAAEAGLAVRDGEVVDAWWGEARGRKAFNRLAALPSGAFAVTLDEPATERTIDTDLGTLVVEAVEERLAYEEVLHELPSLESQPQVKVGKGFFEIQFSPVERQTLARAQQAKTLGQLVDRVPATDLEVAQSIVSLLKHGVMTLKEPVQRVHVFTDSTADLIPAEARRMGITMMAVSIIFGKEVYKDGIDLKPDDFVRKLGESGSLPVTNPVTKGEFREAFRRAVPTGDVLAVLCSSRLSHSYENAVAAIDEGMDDISELRREAQDPTQPVVIAIDSGQASSPLGMLAIFAARLVQRGLQIREAAALVESIAERVQTLLSVSSLDYLQRSGELRKEHGSRPASGMRPILALSGGELNVVDQVTSGKTLPRLLELFTERVDPKRPVFAAVVHASAPAQAALLRQHLERRFTIVELIENQIGPAVTCHVGPGAIGAGLFQPTEKELELLAAPGKG